MRCGVPANNGLERTRHCMMEPRRSTQCWADYREMKPKASDGTV
jgi:hypothetical protein